MSHDLLVLATGEIVLRDHRDGHGIVLYSPGTDRPNAKTALTDQMVERSNVVQLTGELIRAAATGHATHTDPHPGMIVRLSPGMTVVIASDSGDGWFRAVVIHSTTDHYRPGCADIAISLRDIADGDIVPVTPALAKLATAQSVAHGPPPTIEAFIDRLTRKEPHLV